MASRQSVSSILKPPKVRAPLKEIESVDQDADENTATLAKRKVSFSGMNKIKMYNTGATSLTVHQAPMFDEQISMLSDSSNAEKHKLSGKFEKSDVQISNESTNCTNLEDNGRIIIEYESPNDNMEMTEALSGKILSDTIYTIDNNGSEHIGYSSDYSENSMEFTEALKGGQILSGDNGCTSLSSTEMSETLDDKCDDEPVSQLGFKPSTPLSDMLIKNPSNVSSSSSCMDFTCANAKSNLFYNTQSSNMELTGQNMTLKSSKSIWSNDDYKCMSMELTQLPDRQTFEDNCELVYEYSQHSVSTGSDIPCEIQEKQNCELEIVQPEKLEKNNLNHQTIGVLNNSDNREAFIEELSSSMVSMDIDPTLEGNEFDISYVNVEDPLLVVNEQNHSTMPTTVGIEDSSILEKSVLDNYSNIINTTNQNSESRLSIFPTGSSFVANMSPENNVNKYVEVEELLQQTLHGHTSVLDENQYLENNKSIVVEKHLPKKYSRKTMIHTCPLIVQYKADENEDIPGTVNSNQQKYYSRKSIAPTTVFDEDVLDTSETLEENQQQKCSSQSISMSAFNQTQSLETENLSDTSGIVEESHQNKYSRKSVAPTTVFDEDVLDTSETLEEYQQQKCSLQSIAMSALNQTQSLETENFSDTSEIVKENHQNKYSRKSVAPTSVFNDYVLDTSETLEENQQQNCSLQSIAMSALNQTQSLETEDVPNTSVYNPTKLAEKCDTTECSSTQSAGKGETSIYNSTQSAEKGETSIYNSTQSAEMEDTSVNVEGCELKRYSRKSIGPASLVFTHSESLDNSISNNSLDIEESYEPKSEKGTSPVIPVSVNNLSILQSDVSSHYEEKLIPKSLIPNIISDDNFNSPFRKKPKKSIVPTLLARPPVEDPCIKNELETTDDNISGNFENVSKMDISMDILIEHEHKSDNELLVVSKEGEELNEHIVHSDMLETNEDNFVMPPNELDINKTNLNELVKDNDIFEESEKKNEENNKKDSIKVTDNNIVTNHILNSDYHSSSCSVDKTTKSNETFQNNEKSCQVNRKRSYSNRDCVPLSCSSFTSKPNIHNSMEGDLNTDDIIQQSPIKNDIDNMSLDDEQLAIGNELEVELINKESIKESLCNECLEFLTRWNEQFIEKKLTLDKCTNREWIFNLLDSNIILTVTYSYISNNYSLLKVEDISFTAKAITKNEIIQFGINWILSKYNPKVYKQICFTSRDVELLLKSLLEDVEFISKVMKNMSYVSDLYCVTFKDNKAQFVIHNMKCLMMTRIEITLSNIHKLSFKDLSVDCLFGNFDIKLLEEIMEDIIKDCNVLQSLIEKLFKLYSHKIN